MTMRGFAERKCGRNGASRACGRSAASRGSAPSARPARTRRQPMSTLRFTPLPNYAASFGAGVDVTSRLYAAVMGNYDDGGVNEQVVNDDIAVTRFESFVKVNASANYKLSERVSLTLRLENLFNAARSRLQPQRAGLGWQQPAHHRHAARSRHDRRRRAAGALLMPARTRAPHGFRTRAAPPAIRLGTFLADPGARGCAARCSRFTSGSASASASTCSPICVSGSALVFHHELAELALAEYHHVPAHEQPDEANGRRRLTLSEVAAIMDRDRPDLRILSLRPPSAPTARSKRAC